MEKMPKWADATLVPLISLLLAAILSALVILAIGEDPVAALKLMVEGALMRSSGWGYTLYYATNFIFTGLAVSVAFHARLFNIGGEGQAMIGGLGVALCCLLYPVAALEPCVAWLQSCCRAFGAAWALIPAYLQAKRGSTYRDHHDHVQLHRLFCARLYAGQCSAPSPRDGACFGQVPSSYKSAHV